MAFVVFVRWLVFAVLCGVVCRVPCTLSVDEGTVVIGVGCSGVYLRLRARKLVFSVDGRCARRRGVELGSRAAASELMCGSAGRRRRASWVLLEWREHDAS